MIKLSTEPYKGVRDFYPKDQAVQNHIFHAWRSVAEQYGYEEYNASILEPTELYTSKTSDEIVNEQTYSFIDRGERKVTLRPEMTPTLARMVEARKRDLSFPVRWYSIPNLFRYERPQRGRLREHWQLNVDMFGIETMFADAEVIRVAHKIMLTLGATEKDFEVRVSTRKMINVLFTECLDVTDDNKKKIMRLIDSRLKMEPSEFNKGMQEILGDDANLLLGVLNAHTIQELRTALPPTLKETVWIDELDELFTLLTTYNIHNAVFDPSIMRGFDYYTGTVFELFDTNPENRRAVCGGGRYDRLLEIFDGDPIPAVGFGFGDVSMYLFLESRNLLPSEQSLTHLALCSIDTQAEVYAITLAEELRGKNVRVLITTAQKRLSDQLKHVNKQHVPFVVCIGEEEMKSNQYKLKNLATGAEVIVARDELAKQILIS